MSDHNLYMAESVTLGTDTGAFTPKGFVQLTHSIRRTKVIPQGSIRARKRYTTKIEETITVECEQIDGVEPPTGPVAFEAKGVRPMVGDALGTHVTWKTTSTGTVEVDDVEYNIDGGAGNRMRITLSVNSPDGLASGIEKEATT